MGEILGLYYNGSKDVLGHIWILLKDLGFRFLTVSVCVYIYTNKKVAITISGDV